MREFIAKMSLEEWFGLIGIIAVIAFAIVTAYISRQTTLRVGRQKVAEARLIWADRYSAISLELDSLLLSLDRERDSGKLRSIVTDRKRSHARKLATELMYMVNPDSDGPAASDEYTLEIELLSRLSHVGIKLDMNNIRIHRKVLKHNWKQAKSEF